MTDGPAADVADTDIAIVGMAGRFPGAPDVDALWRRVAAGEDCLVDLDADALIAAGLPADMVARSRLRAAHRHPRRRRHVRQRAVRHRRPRRRRSWTRSTACSWSACGRRSSRPATCPSASTVRSACSPAAASNTYLINNLITNPKLRRADRLVPAPPHQQRQGLPADVRVLQARPPRAVGERADGVLDLARRRSTSPPRA